MNRWLRCASCLLIVAGVAVAVSCEDDPAAPGPTTRKFQNLTQRSHVLENIELAYNRRGPVHYVQTLDADFTFFLAPGDVGGGLPEQWGRVEESWITFRLFDACRNIDLDIRTEDGGQWVQVHPESAPGETWYTTTLYYEFKIELGEDTFLSMPGAKAQFTVRDAGSDDTPHWQLVEMRDLVGPSPSYAGISSGVRSRTWGQIKSLFL